MMKLTAQWQRRLGDDVPLTADQPADAEWVPPADVPAKIKQQRQVLRWD